MPNAPIKTVGLMAKPRSERATEVLFNNPTSLDIFTWLDDMESAGLLVSNGNSAAASVNNLLAVCNGESGMPIDTSAAGRSNTGLAIARNAWAKLSTD